MWRGKEEAGKEGREWRWREGGASRPSARPAAILTPLICRRKDGASRGGKESGSGGRLETWQRRPRSSRVDKKLKLLRCHSTSPADRPRPSLPRTNVGLPLLVAVTLAPKSAFECSGDSFLFFSIKRSRQLCRLQTILLNRGHSGPFSRHYLLNFGSLSYRDGGPRWLAPYLAGSPLRPVA